DWVTSRPSCSRIAPCPARAPSTPLPSRNTSGSWANSAMAPSIPRYREKERDGPIGGDARLQVHALPSDGVGHCLEIRGIGLTDDLRLVRDDSRKGGTPWEAVSRPKTAPRKAARRAGDRGRRRRPARSEEGPGRL